MPLKTRQRSSYLVQFLILGGVILLVWAILALKDDLQPEIPTSLAEQPETQFDAALKAGRPAVAFFHSNNCEQCIIMVERVGQIYPEFSDRVILIDVDVYNPNNEHLLQKVRLQYIPTLIFYDQHGQTQTFVGVMEADELRDRLAILGGKQ